jgi:hypothetical protein
MPLERGVLALIHLRDPGRVKIKGVLFRVEALSTRRLRSLKNISPRPFKDSAREYDSTPGFTVTGSMSIGRQGWYLETSAGTSDHE